MLDLNASAQSVAGLDLARDSEKPDTFYILPPAPSLALAEGIPDLTLLRFVDDNNQVTSGNLQFSTELPVDDEKIATATALLKEELNLEEIFLQPVAVQHATAELMFLGREPTAEGGVSGMIRRGIGRVDAQMNAPHRAFFSIDLDPDGVKLIESALRTGAAPVGIVYRLEIEGLWPAQRVIATINWTQVYAHFSEHYKDGAFITSNDIKRISEELQESKVIRIQAIEGLEQSEESSFSTENALAWIQRELIERFCEPVMPLSRAPAKASLGTVGEILDVGSDYTFKAHRQIEHATATVDFQIRTVLKRTLTAQSHLLHLLENRNLDDHIGNAVSTHPFFERIKLHITTVQPLEELFIEEVILNISYGTTNESLQLTKDSPEVIFDTWRDVSPDGSWTVVADVRFADQTPFDSTEEITLPSINGHGRALILDMATLLRLHKINIFTPTDNRIMLSMIQLQHSREGDLLHEQAFQVPTGTASTAVWLQDYRRGDRVTLQSQYLTSLGILKKQNIPVDSQIVRLASPFMDKLTIQVLSDSDWSNLNKVVVGLRKEDGIKTGSIIFDKPDDFRAVSLEMPDPTNRKYRYKVERHFKDGRVETDDWHTTEMTALVVGEVSANILIVDIMPLGIEPPQAGINIIQVELQYLDVPNQVRHQKTHVIRSLANTFRWKVVIKNPELREYEYRLTTQKLNGETVVGRWIKQSDKILPIVISDQ